jgi:hypothetical protein
MSCRNPWLVCLALLFGLPLVAEGQDAQSVRLGPLAGRSTLGERAEVVDFWRQDTAPTGMRCGPFDYVDELTDLLPSTASIDAIHAIAGAEQIDSVAADFDGDGVRDVVAAWEVAGREIAVGFFAGGSLPGLCFVAPFGGVDAGIGLLNPNANPHGYTRSDRVLHLAAGNLDRDAEEEVVLAYWDESGAVRVLVYDADGAAPPPAPVVLEGGPGEVLPADDRLTVFAVAVADFDADLVGEIALVLPVAANGNQIDLVASLYAYDPEAEGGPAVFRRGGGSFSVPIDANALGFSFLDHVVAEPVDLAPRPGFDALVGLRPDWLAVAVGGSRAVRVEIPVFPPQVTDEWPVQTRLATLAFDRGPDLCGSGGDLDFCLAAAPDVLILPDRRTAVYDCSGCELEGVLFEDPPAALCLGAGALSGNSFEELALFRYDQLYVYRGTGTGGALELVLQRSRLFFEPEWAIFASACDIEVTDLDAAPDAAEWAPELTIALQATGSFGGIPGPHPADILHAGQRSLLTDVWTPVVTTGTDGSRTLTNLVLAPPSLTLVSEPPTPSQPRDEEWRLRPRTTSLADLDGDRVLLGEPTRTERTVIQPLIVLPAAPIHYDVLGGVPIDVNDCFGAAVCDFVSTYVRQSAQEVTVSSEFNAEWKLSTGFLGALADAIGLSLTSGYGHGFSEFESSTTRIEVTQQRNVRLFDQVLTAEVGYDLWEYPVWDDVAATEPAGYVTAVVPVADEDRTSWKIADDRDLLYFSPDHEPGNLLSYRSLADLPAATNSSLRIGGHGLAEQPIVPGSDFTWKLSVFSGGAEEQRRGTFSESAIGASLGFRVFDLFDVGLTGSYATSFETVTTNAKSQEDVLDVQVFMGAVDTLDLRYDVTPVVAWDPSGAVVLDYAVEFPATGFFQQAYGVLPDPALSLPHRWDVAKGLTASNDRELETRDLLFVPADPQPGQDVRILVRVHNYSLVDTPNAVRVHLYEGESRFGRLIASVTTDGPIPAREDAIIRDVLWTVPAAANLETLAVWVELEPVGGFAQIHEGNDVGWRAVSPDFVPEPDGPLLGLAALLALLGLRRVASEPKQL